MTALLFNGQDYRLILDTGIDISTATATKILYKKPNGVSSEWTAAIVGTTLLYDIPALQNDIPGLWEFQSYVEMAGKKFIGEIVLQDIANNIK